MAAARAAHQKRASAREKDIPYTPRTTSTEPSYKSEIQFGAMLGDFPPRADALPSKAQLPTFPISRLPLRSPNIPIRLAPYQQGAITSKYANITTLPKELMTPILDALDWKSLKSLFLTCTYMYNYLSDAEIHKSSASYFKARAANEMPEDVWVTPNLTIGHGYRRAGPGLPYATCYTCNRTHRNNRFEKCEVSGERAHGGKEAWRRCCIECKLKTGQIRDRWSARKMWHIEEDHSAPVRVGNGRLEKLGSSITLGKRFGDTYSFHAEEPLLYRICPICEEMSIGATSISVHRNDRSTLQEKDLVCVNCEPKYRVAQQHERADEHQPAQPVTRFTARPDQQSLHGASEQLPKYDEFKGLLNDVQ
ncbi:MAG: hypothetical protein Q9227_008829, partial [Pyrenula ochraceoflavens]